MKPTPIILAIAGFLAACSAAPTTQPIVAPVADVCNGNVSLAQDLKAIAGIPSLKVVQTLTDAKAVDFIKRTGGADAPWLDQVKTLIVVSGLMPAAYGIAVFDKQGCKIVQVLLHEDVVFGKGA